MIHFSLVHFAFLWALTFVFVAGGFRILYGPLRLKGDSEATTTYAKVFWTLLAFGMLFASALLAFPMCVTISPA